MYAYFYARFLTVTRMWIGVNKTGIENLFGKHVEQLFIDVGNVEFVTFDLFNVAYFVSINPLGGENTMCRQIPFDRRYMNIIEFFHVFRTSFGIVTFMNEIKFLECNKQ